jgi:hypothetical protein
VNLHGRDTPRSRRFPSPPPPACVSPQIGPHNVGADSTPRRSQGIWAMIGLLRKIPFPEDYNPLAKMSAPPDRWGDGAARNRWGASSSSSSGGVLCFVLDSTAARCWAIGSGGAHLLEFMLDGARFLSQFSGERRSRGRGIEIVIGARGSFGSRHPCPAPFLLVFVLGAIPTCSG